MVRRQIILALVLGTTLALTACGSSASTEAVNTEANLVLALQNYGWRTR